MKRCVKNQFFYGKEMIHEDFASVNNSDSHVLELKSFFLSTDVLFPLKNVMPATV